ncbi:unnamed protein product [Microthlaspi erraticum]|uniref:Retrotransposon gag domain-containing protein n=1 Tax=Microthlaspi erraticum TaxID=1685480 RepID=A0A6D2KBP2_9BRAS|nr:unnamed protein product [Microthlaspi erraticum]
MLEEKLAHFPEPVIITRLDECYLGFNNWRPPWGWKRFSLFISKISRFSRTSNDGNSKENTPTGSPSPSEENLSDSLPRTIDKSLPAEGRDKPAPTKTISRRRDPSRREDLSAAKIYFAATIPSAKKGREPPSVRTTPLEKIFLERQTPQLEEILLEREDPQTHGESRQATRRRFRVNASTAEKDSGTGDLPPRARTDESSPRRGRFESSSRHQLSSGIDESTRRHPKKPAHPQAPPDRTARKRLKIDSYTGEEDPKKWLTAFNLAMRREKYKSYDEREANYCQVFVEHMAKDALTWFSNLPAESIDNFDDLTNAFLKHYSMHMTRITRNMFTTTQTQGEPLRSFMERFKQAARDTGDMPDSVPLEALRNGLWYDSKFKEDLSLKPPATLEDAFHRSRNYIFLEEDQRFYAEKHGDRRATSSKPRENPWRHEEDTIRRGLSSQRSQQPTMSRAKNEQEHAQPFRCHKTSTRSEMTTIPKLSASSTGNWPRH